MEHSVTDDVIDQWRRLGMYRIPVFEIRPEPDCTGFLKTYPARTGQEPDSLILGSHALYTASGNK